MKRFTKLCIFSLSTLFFGWHPAYAQDKPVGIGSGNQMRIEFMVDGKKVSISRNQDNSNTINDDFALTSRPCPPFCIQPSTIAPGVETIGELEVIEYLQAMHRGEPVVVQDSRTPQWHKRGHIPGSINIPWSQLALQGGANIIDISEILLEQFSVQEVEGLFDFGKAKTLVLYCNGMWCGQSPVAIKTLLSLGYPAHKIKWYRGGMQDWEVLGLNTVQ